MTLYHLKQDPQKRLGLTETFELSHERLDKPPCRPRSRTSIDDSASTLVDYPRCYTPADGDEDGHGHRHENGNGDEDKSHEDDEPVLRFRENPEERHEYPNAWKLMLITIGICLCVFCMALVGFPAYAIFWVDDG